MSFFNNTLFIKPSLSFVVAMCVSFDTSLPPPPKACLESQLSIVQVHKQCMTNHSPHQTQLEKKNPFPPTHKKKKKALSLDDVSSP
jgi:hypothetical protein